MMPKGVDHHGWTWAGDPEEGVQKSLMPKGVDHSSPSGGTDCVCGVQKSLMPKGVDHMPCRKSVPGLASAKIFDAERR